MKKYLIFLVLSISLFLGIEKTKAATNLNIDDVVSYRSYRDWECEFVYNSTTTFSIKNKTFNKITNINFDSAYPYVTITLERGSSSNYAFVYMTDKPLIKKDSTHLGYDLNTNVKRFQFSSSYEPSIQTYIITSNNYVPVEIVVNSGRSTLLITNYSQNWEFNTTSYYFNYQGNYTYENYVNCNGISEITINFLTPINESIDFNLDFKSIFVGNDVSKPYLQYNENISGNNNIVIDDFLGNIEQLQATDINGNELYQYSGIINDSNWLAIPLQNLKIVIDVSNYGDYDYYLKFETNLAFTVSTRSVLEDFNYWTTIDMTDKYGIYLIPKTLNQDVYQTINLVGAYDIQVRSNYISDDNFTMSDFFLNYTEPNFQYLFSLNDINTLLYFMNCNYVSGTDTGHYITFDSRYFTYAIKESQFQEPVIYNPNTGQDITITDPVDIDDTDDVKSFVKTIQLYLGKFSELLTYLYNSFPPLLKRALTSLFLILIITSAVLIARGRR